MDLRQLRTFQAVAELGSLSKASDRLSIVQPALSRQIKLLEHELKTTLFIRDSRGMLLTQSGKLLLKRSADLIRELDQLKHDVLSTKENPSGRVVVGLIPSASYVLASRVARRVIAMYPDITLRIVEGYAGHLVDRLTRREIDFAVLYRVQTEFHFHVQDLAHDEFMVVGSARNTSLAAADSGSLEWLSGQPLFLPSYVRAILEPEASRRNVSLNVRLEGDSYRILVEMIEKNLGLTILPLSAVDRGVADGTLKAIPLVDPKITRKLVLARQAPKEPSVAMKAVADVICEEVKAVSDAGLWISDALPRQDAR